MKAGNLLLVGSLKTTQNAFLDITNNMLIMRAQDRRINHVTEVKEIKTIGFTKKSKNIRAIECVSSDMNSGNLLIGGNLVAKVGNELANNGGTVMSGGDMYVKARKLTATANIDRNYQMSYATGGGSFQDRSCDYARVTESAVCPTSVSGGRKQVVTDELSMKGANFISNSDLQASVLGDAKLEPCYTIMEGEKDVSRRGMFGTSVSQRTLKHHAPCAVSSNAGNVGMDVGGHLSSQATIWHGKDIDISARSADFTAAADTMTEYNMFSGMMDPITYAEGVSVLELSMARPSVFKCDRLKVKTEGDLRAEAPIVDAESAIFKSTFGSVNIEAAENKSMFVQDMTSLSVSFFRSSTIQAALNNEKGWGMHLLHEFPLLSSLHALTQSHGDQASACNVINGAFAAISTTQAIQSAGGLTGYLVNKLGNISCTLTQTSEERAVIQQIGMEMLRPKSSLVISAGGDVNITGLKGSFSSLFVKGENVRFNPLKTLTDWSMVSNSVSVSYNVMTESVGIGASTSISSGHSVTYDASGLHVDNLSISGKETLQIGVFLDTLSTFIDTKRLTIKSHVGSSESTSESYSFSMDTSGAVGGSIGGGYSYSAHVAQAGIKANTCFVNSPEGIELIGASIQLSESAEPTLTVCNSEAFYEFKVYQSYNGLSGTFGSLSEALNAISSWSSSTNSTVRVWHKVNDRLQLTDTFAQPSSEKTENILLQVVDGPVTLSLLSTNQCVLQADVIQNQTLEGRHEEYYFGLAVSDVLGLLSLDSAISVDYKDIAREIKHRTYLDPSITNSIEGNEVARSLADQVQTTTNSKTDISLKNIVPKDIISPFIKYEAVQIEDESTVYEYSDDDQIHTDEEQELEDYLNNHFSTQMGNTYGTDPEGHGFNTNSTVIDGATSTTDEVLPSVPLTSTPTTERIIPLIDDDQSSQGSIEDIPNPRWRTAESIDSLTDGERRTVVNLMNLSYAAYKTKLFLDQTNDFCMAGLKFGTIDYKAQLHGLGGSEKKKVLTVVDETSKTLTIAGPGSAGTKDWINNITQSVSGATIQGQGEVFIHRGMRDEGKILFTALEPVLVEYAQNGYNIVITGHSRFGAVGAFTLLEFHDKHPGLTGNTRLFTFNSAAAGDLRLANAFAKKFPGRIYNFRDSRDPIGNLGGPFFRPVGEQFYVRPDDEVTAHPHLLTSLMKNFIKSHCLGDEGSHYERVLDNVDKEIPSILQSRVVSPKLDDPHVVPYISQRK